MSGSRVYSLIRIDFLSSFLFPLCSSAFCSFPVSVSFAIVKSTNGKRALIQSMFDCLNVIVVCNRNQMTIARCPLLIATFCYSWWIEMRQTEQCGHFIIHYLFSVELFVWIIIYWFMNDAPHECWSMMNTKK